MRIKNLHEDEGGKTKPIFLLFLINAVLSVGNAEKIAVGLQKLAGMTHEQLMVMMAKAQPGTSYLQNFLSSKPSNVRKLIPIFSQLGEDVVDQLIDEAMGIKEGDEYDSEGDLYYSAGEDEGGGGC